MEQEWDAQERSLHPRLLWIVAKGLGFSSPWSGFNPCFLSLKMMSLNKLLPL